MSNVLVIIDMQPDFKASRGKAILNEHVKQVRQAIKEKQHIVIIEYKDAGDTHKRIRQTVRGYSLVNYIIKNTCSGSQLLVKLFNKLGFWPKKVSFMGVNTGACVGDTAIYFHRHVKNNKKDTEIEIIQKGCRCGTSNNYGEFSRFENLGIKVI